MILKDISLASPQENILYDDLLLQQAEEGDEEFIRFWESPTHFIVLGRTCKEEDDLKIEQITKDGMPVLRRSSGGGTVIQGHGCLNYSLILSKEKTPEIADLRKSYAFILNKIVQALKNIDRECTFLPISDIAMVQNQKKVSGNAQKRGRKCILHHGTLLYSFDLRLIERYLQMPKDIPEYRQGRNHLDFVANLNVSSEELKNEIAKMFPTERTDHRLSPDETHLLSQLTASKPVVIKFS